VRGILVELFSRLNLKGFLCFDPDALQPHLKDKSADQIRFTSPEKRLADQQRRL